MHNKNYISVGIDVGSAFSFMTILAPDETVILKPFKITHNNLLRVNILYTAQYNKML